MWGYVKSKMIGYQQRLKDLLPEKPQKNENILTGITNLVFNFVSINFLKKYSDEVISVGINNLSIKFGEIIYGTTEVISTKIADLSFNFIPIEFLNSYSDETITTSITDLSIKLEESI